MSNILALVRRAALAAFALSAPLSAQNNINWEWIRNSSGGDVLAGAPGQTITIRARVQNTGLTYWDGNYYLELKSDSQHLYYPSISGVGPGGVIECDFYLTLPSTTGSYSYYFTAVQNGVEYFGPTHWRSVSVESTNRPPNWTSPTGSPTATVGQSLSYEFRATDPDGNLSQMEIAWRTPSGAVWAIHPWFAAQSPISKIVTFNQGPGTYELWVNASDSAGLVRDPWSQNIAGERITITVTQATAPQITSHPSHQTVSTGGNATFSVGASGSGPLSYQWRKNGSNIAGATNASYTVSSAQLSDSGSSYSVVVTNSAGSVISNPATLTVMAGARQRFTVGAGYSTIQSAINAACAAGGQTEVYIPAGRYALNTALVLAAGANRNIWIVGEGPNITVLECATLQSGFLFDFANNSEQVVFRDFTLEPQGNCGTGIRAAFPADPVAGSSVRNVEIDNVHLLGSYGDIFTTGIELARANRARLYNCYLSNGWEGGLQGSAIKFPHRCPNAEIIACNVSHVEKAIEFSAVSSSLPHRDVLITDDVAVGVTYGVIAAGGAPTQRVTIKNTHIDTRKSGMSLYLADAIDTSILGNFLLSGEANTPGYTYAMVLNARSSSATSPNRSVISANRIHGLLQGGQIVLQGASNGSVLQYTGWGHTIGYSVWLQTSASGYTATGNHSYDPSFSVLAEGSPNTLTNNN
jgi:hypothetical protein